MKNFYILLFLHLFFNVFAQNEQRYYAGYFNNKKGNPENNLKITNKNSGFYEFSDQNGFVIIPAKIGDTLVWNMREFKVVQSYELQEITSILASKKQYNSSIEQTNKFYVDKVKNNFKKNTDSTDFLFSAKDGKKTNKGKRSDFTNYQKISEKDSAFILKKKKISELKFTGSFQTLLEIGSANALPKTQNKYVQGRNINGNLVWRGAETNEMFSFGPDISTLSFDGNLYQYDENGRLVPSQNGLKPAQIYKNRILQNSIKNSNNLTLNTALKIADLQLFSMKLDLGNSKENSIFRNNYINYNHLNISLLRDFKFIKVTFGYKLNEEKATNSNRIGYFNRLFQNALLTPISFSNEQGNLLVDKQRSYSILADNPYYLLGQNKKFNYIDNQKNIFLNLEKTNKNFKYFINQSYEKIVNKNIDFYNPFTVGFYSGLNSERIQNDENYNLNFGANYSFGHYDTRSSIFFNSLINSAKSEINYLQFNQKYRYNRISQDYVLKYNFDFRNNNFKFNLDAANSFYISNTAKSEHYWLPKLNFSLGLDDAFDSYTEHNFKIFGAYGKSVNEVNINKSFANFATTQILPSQIQSFFPTNEVLSFKNLEPISTTEKKIGLQYNVWRNRINFEAVYFHKSITDDIFPTFENGNLVLKNIGNHINNGFELNLQLNNFPFGYSLNFRDNHKITFTKYRSEVTQVNSHEQFFPIAGFSDVYRALVKGEALGSIVGTAYQRDNSGKIIIGNDGFPLVSPNLKVIGNPIPDFIIKFSHEFKIYDFSLNIDWEWRKGGDVWNGTAANLDYYGRSQNSADQRNIANYTFSGVLQNGAPNNILVDFYNVNQSFENNLWYRYGFTGVAENYISKADQIRLNNILLSYTFRRNILPFNELKMSASINNFIIWSKYKGVDATQNFYNSRDIQGLDFYNLPSVKSYALQIAVKF